MCCRVLPCVAMCCHVLLCVVVLQRIVDYAQRRGAVCRGKLQCIAVHCRVLQRVAVCRSVLMGVDM